MSSPGYTLRPFLAEMGEIEGLRSLNRELAALNLDLARAGTRWDRDALEALQDELAALTSSLGYFQRLVEQRIADIKQR